MAAVAEFFDQVISFGGSVPKQNSLRLGFLT